MTRPVQPLSRIMRCQLQVVQRRLGGGYGLDVEAFEQRARHGIPDFVRQSAIWS
jgi:hypothetical protein